MAEITSNSVVLTAGDTVAVTQATAANLNATVVGTGSAGTPASGVVTVQGIGGGTGFAVTGVGSAGSPNASPMTIQGIASMTPVATNLMQVLGAAHSAANPLFAAPVQGGGAVAVANPLSTVPGVISASVSKGGTTNAPTAGTAFVSFTANQPAGTYEVTLMYNISGANETLPLNVRLSDASGGFSAIDFPSSNGAPATGSAAVLFGPYIVPSVAVTGTNTIKLTAVASATASTVYSGVMSLRRIA